MKFKCTVCGKNATIMDSDENRFKLQEWECDLCYSIIPKQRYSKSEGGTVIFSDMWEKIGDKIKGDTIVNYYKSQNPTETIIELHKKDFISPAQAYQKYKDLKRYFLFDNNKFSIENQTGRFIKLSATAETRALSIMGIYPTWKEFEKPSISLPQKYIIFHARNSNDRNPSNLKEKHPKSMTNQEFNLLMELTEHWNYKILIIGNDKPLNSEILHKNVIDIRNKLTLNQLAYILRSKRCKGYIGKDSGPVHMAAMNSHYPIFAWGYITKQWFPLTKNKMVNFVLYNQDQKQLKQYIQQWEASIDEK